MPPLPRKAIAGLVGVSGAIVYHERNATPYTPTFSSVVPASWHVGSTAIPAFLMEKHEEAPAGGYRQENREFLNNATPHVKSVNDKLEKKNVGLSDVMAYTLLKQDEAKPTYGSAEDIAHEREIITGFYSEFKLNLVQGKSLMEQGVSSEDLSKIKHEATYNLVGSAAHTAFAIVKSISYGLATTPGLDKDGLHLRSEKHYQTSEEHSVQLKQNKHNIEKTTTYRDFLAKQRAEIKEEKINLNHEEKNTPSF